MNSGDDESLIQFGRRLRTIRRSLDLTQATLASAIGVSRGSVANIEAGRQDPGVTGLIAIAQALGVTAQDLIFETSAVAAASAWLRMAERITASERRYRQLAEDSWKTFDIITAVRHRSIADGLELARDHQLEVSAECRERTILGETFGSEPSQREEPAQNTPSSRG